MDITSPQPVAVLARSIAERLPQSFRPELAQEARAVELKLLASIAETSFASITALQVMAHRLRAIEKLLEPPPEDEPPAIPDTFPGRI